MNNIFRLHSFVDYPELDVITLHQAASGASNAGIEVERLFIQTSYLPSLRARVAGANNAMRDAHFNLREVAQSLDNKININTRALREYQAELESATDSDRQEILEDISKQIARIVSIVSRDQTVLNRLLTPMKVHVDRVATGNYLVQLAADRERLPTEILEIKARQELLEQKRQTLTDAMALIEAKGFAQVGKETMLTAQEIAKLGMAGPEVAAINTAIELAQQTMEKLETLISYFGLMDARNTIRKQIDDLLASTYDKTIELRMVDMKGDLIRACHDFDDQRTHYIAEFEKLIQAKQSFLSVYRAVDAEDPQTVTAFVVDVLALASYLKAVA